MKTLLLTDIPPCSNLTAGIVTAQICRALTPGRVVVFSVTNEALSLEPFPDLAEVPIDLYPKPNEDYSVGNFSEEEVYSAEARICKKRLPQLIKAAVAFALSHDVTQVWAILQGQTMVRMALAVAQTLGVPLKSQIWDPLSWWQKARHLDPRTCQRDDVLLDRTLRASAFVAAPSWAMAARIRELYGVASHPIIGSIDQSLAHPPATDLRKDGKLFLGMAGQFYAADAWLALCSALAASKWRVGDREVFINVYGGHFLPNEVDPARVRQCGWYEQAKLIDAISRDCDICYCPYPFSVDFEEVAKLSFPSKIPIYFATGKPILFHGPKYSSPSGYLLERDAAICVHTESADAILTAIERLAGKQGCFADTATRGSEALIADFTSEQQRRLVQKYLLPDRGEHERSTGRVIRRMFGWLGKTVRKIPANTLAAKHNFDFYYYWNKWTDVRSYKGGIFNHYCYHGWKEGRDPHPLFSVDFYLASRPDVRSAGVEPFTHYLEYGWKEGSDPHPLFSVSHYLERVPDVAGINPLRHFLTDGWKKGVDPHPLFSVSHYLAARPDVAARGINPLTHYLIKGWKERTNPHPLFSVRHYLTRRSDVLAAGVEPFAHYLCYGWKEGSDPHPLFSVSFYLAQQPDAVRLQAEPLQHYLSTGCHEGSAPHRLFSTQRYLELRPDVAACEIEPLSHYLRFGWKEGVDPNPFFSVSYYLARRPDLMASGEEPFTHYLEFGWKEGIDPHPLFSVCFYLAQRPDAEASGAEPMQHFMEIGSKESSNPHPLFSVNAYLDRRPDVAAAGIDPLTHYLLFGRKEKIHPSKWFSKEFYQESYPDIVESRTDLLIEYLTTGWKAGRDPNPWFDNNFYRETNPDVDFDREPPLTHYVRIGWSQGRDPNPWFSVADYRRRRGLEGSDIEPMTHLLENGDPIIRPTTTVTNTDHYIRNYRNTIMLRQATRENDRLRSSLAASKRAPLRAVDQQASDPRQRYLSLVEDVLVAAGERVAADLEVGTYSEDVEFRIWGFLHELSQCADVWLRSSLVGSGADQMGDLVASEPK